MRNGNPKRLPKAWDGVDFTHDLMRAKRWFLVLFSIQVCVVFVLSGVLLFKGIKPQYVPVPAYLGSVMFGFGASLCTGFGALGLFKRDDEFYPPNVIINGVIAPAAGTIGWALGVFLVFPMWRTSEPAWIALLDKPFTFYVVSLILNFVVLHVLFRCVLGLGHLLSRRVRKKSAIS